MKQYNIFGSNRGERNKKRNSHKIQALRYVDWRVFNENDTQRKTLLFEYKYKKI